MSTQYFVGIYEVDLVYGGPEEGGWWFNTGTLHRVVGIAKNAETAYAMARHYNKILREHVNKHRPSIGSVLSEGIFQAEVHRNVAPDSYPIERPHYE